MSNASINDNSALELETEEQTPAVWMQGKGREAMDVELPIQKRNKWTKLTSLETKKRKYEEQKFIANSFCDRGIDYQAAV